MKNETFTPERIKAEADAFFEWDGEDRSLVTTTSCLLFAQHIAGLMQARSAQPAPVVPEECPHLILFDDAKMKPIMFAGTGARRGALAKWEQVSKNWNAHLFVRIEKNSRDDRYPCAMLAAAPAQGQQVECQECGRLRGDFEELAERYGKLQAGEDSLLAKVVTERDQLRAELAALKAQQVGQEPQRCQCCGYLVTESEHRGCLRAAAPQPAPAQDVAGWIPVSERLPEVGERVLGSTDTVEEVTYWAHKPGVHDGEAGWCDTHENLVEVTHWMPLPAAPAHDKQSGGVE